MVVARGVRGAFTQGKNLAEAKKMIKEAIEGMIEAQVIIDAEKEGVVQIKHKQFTHIA